MHHLRAEQIVRYASGELTPDERAAADAHLAACPRCAEELRTHQALFNALGAWTATPPYHATLDADKLFDAGQRPLRVRQWNARPWRVAAAVFLGVGLGYAGQRLTRHDPPAPPSPTQSPDLTLFAADETVGLDNAIESLLAAPREDLP